MISNGCNIVNIIYNRCNLDYCQRFNRDNQIKETTRGGRMCQTRIIFGLALLLSCSLGFSQAAAQQESMSMEQMEEILLERSESLKQNVTLLKQQLQELQEQQTTLKTTLTSLEQYCSNILEEYNDCVQTLDSYKNKLKDKETQLRKLRTTLVILFILFIVVRVVTIILKLKFGIQLPYILNAIL